MKITVVFNNIVHDKNLEIGWGFSAYIEGLEKNILFDTGSDGNILLANMEKLGLDPGSIDVVVLSHAHHDHTGGLISFLEKNKHCTVIAPDKEVVAMNKPMKVCEKAWSSGLLGGRIQEQALAIDSEKGLIILTGCAHPGIVKIVKHIKKTLNKNVYLLMGGFHLEYFPKFMVKKVIHDLKKMGVEKVAPSHCTGEKAIELFKSVWGENFMDLGCGACIKE